MGIKVQDSGDHNDGVAKCKMRCFLVKSVKRKHTIEQTTKSNIWKKIRRKHKDHDLSC